MDDTLPDMKEPEDRPTRDRPRKAQEEIRLGLLGEYVGFHLRLAQASSFRAFQSRTGQDRLKPGWYAVLSIIGDNPGITPVALSRAAGRDKSTLTPVVQDLVRQRYLTREARPDDRRSYGLRLTQEGAAKLAEFSAHAAAHEKVLDEAVGEDREVLIRVLKRISELVPD